MFYYHTYYIGIISISKPYRVKKVIDICNNDNEEDCSYPLHERINNLLQSNTPIKASCSSSKKKSLKKRKIILISIIITDVNYILI